ncbi:hypothetical protein ACQJBY_011045 [Aegilops geniculata]
MGCSSCAPMWRPRTAADGLMLLHVVTGTSVCALLVLGADVVAPDRKGRRWSCRGIWWWSADGAGSRRGGNGPDSLCANHDDLEHCHGKFLFIFTYIYCIRFHWQRQQVKDDVPFSRLDTNHCIQQPGRRTLSMENMAPHEGSLANSLQEDAKVMVLC